MNQWNVLFVGLGPLGRLILSDYLSRRLGSVAGLVDTDPALVGRSAGELVPALGDSTIRVRASIADVLSDLDSAGVTAAVVATSSDLLRCLPTLRELISRGINAVSTCEELLYPRLRHERAAAEIDALCRERGVGCVGTGVNPGFMMDTLPVALSGVCREVRSVRVERHQDAATRRVPFQRKIGAALRDSEFEARAREGSLRHVGLGESLHFIGDCLNMVIARWEEHLEPLRAARSMRCDVGEIHAGGISGVHQTARGWNAAGEELITLDFRAAIGLENPRDRIIIEGDPRIESVIPGAVHGDAATSAITLNAIGSLLRAAPGLHSMATLPITRFERGALRNG